MGIFHAFDSIYCGFTRDDNIKPGLFSVNGGNPSCYNDLMKIDVAKERIIILKDQLSPEDAKKLSWEKKAAAFDALSQVTSFFSRPKDDDFELTYTEHRYEPFWHVVAKARYVYDRSVLYQVSVGGKEVRSVTFLSTDYEELNGHIHVPVTEHCVQDEQDEVYVDGMNGKNVPNLVKYINTPSTEVAGNLEKFVTKGSILVPPNSRVSAIMRDSLAKMIKGIQADKILEEHVEVAEVALYYRPIYAFQYTWVSKAKDGIIEIDGVTGSVGSGNKIFKEYLGKVLDQDFLFDIGADAAGLFIPGGSIAVKAAKQYLKNRR